MPSISNRLALPTVLLWAALSPLSAIALELRPGLWEFQVTMASGMLGNQVVTQQQCLSDTDLDPTMFSTSAGPCSVEETDDSSGNLAWTFACNLEGMQTTGSGNMYVVGETVRGSVKMVMGMPAAAGGQQFTLDNTWEGRRVGDCQ